MARAQKLKVYRTPIGFHDAYVAAPSQKAALAAWGSDADLFARGVAELVADEALSREPLAHPGEVIRRLRGSAEEQIAALSPGRARARKKAAPVEEPTSRAKQRKPSPRPSREALDAAERQLADLVAQQKAEAAALKNREQELARERRDLERKQAHDRAAAEKVVDEERRTHADALDRWIKCS